MSEDRCVCCGSTVPEGRAMCSNCEKGRNIMEKSVVVMVHFTCSRCGKEHVEPIKRNRLNHGNNTFMYDPPEGWKKNETITPMLCDECNKKLQAFLEG